MRTTRQSRPKTKPVVEGVKPNRNDPCPCKSGRKFKNCCQIEQRLKLQKKYTVPGRSFGKKPPVPAATLGSKLGSIKKTDYELTENQ